MSPNPPNPCAAESGLTAAQVVLLALLRIGEHVVCVGDLFEALGCLGTRIHVGMEFAGEATVRLLDLVGCGVACDAEDLVMVGHGGLVLSIAGCRSLRDGRLSQLSPRVRER